MQGFKDAGDFYAHVHKDLDAYRQFAKTVDPQDVTKLTAAEAYATGKRALQALRLRGRRGAPRPGRERPGHAARDPRERPDGLRDLRGAARQLRFRPQRRPDGHRHDEECRPEGAGRASSSPRSPSPRTSRARLSPPTSKFAEGTSQVSVPRRRSTASSPDSRPPSRSHEAIRARPRRARRRGSDARRGRRTARSEDAPEGAGVARRRRRRRRGTLTVRARLATGWHVNSHKPSEDYLIADGGQARAVRRACDSGSRGTRRASSQKFAFSGDAALGLRGGVRRRGSRRVERPRRLRPSRARSSTRPATTPSAWHRPRVTFRSELAASPPAAAGASALPDRRRRPPVGGPPARGLRARRRGVRGLRRPPEAPRPGRRAPAALRLGPRAEPDAVRLSRDSADGQLLRRPVAGPEPPHAAARLGLRPRHGDDVLRARRRGRALRPALRRRAPVAVGPRRRRARARRCWRSRCSASTTSGCRPR